MQDESKRASYRVLIPLSAMISENRTLDRAVNEFEDL
jgi:hypothetical protein